MSININDGLWGNDRPIVIPYGQTSSGKTTALVRLIKYLQDNEYSYNICNTFHKHYYPNVKSDQIQSFFTKQLTRPINEIEGNADAFLCNINKNNETICRFLESPGENLFALANASEKDTFKDGGMLIEDEFQYLMDIIRNRDYKKIWIFLMDPGFTDDLKQEKPAYIARIKQIAKTLGPNDNVIFLVNKYDKVESGYGPIIKAEGLKGYINQLYDGILDMEPFTTKTMRWWWPFSEKTVEHFRIVRFCAYDEIISYKDTDGKKMPNKIKDGDKRYPEGLWKTINDAIMNKF